MVFFEEWVIRMIFLMFVVIYLLMIYWINGLFVIVSIFFGIVFVVGSIWVFKFVIGIIIFIFIFFFI